MVTVYVLVLSVGISSNVLTPVLNPFPDDFTCRVAGQVFLKDMEQDHPRFSCLPIPQK